MNKLADIEAAVQTLPSEDQQKLFFFLAGKMRKQRGSGPEPRDISAEQIQQWIARDEADMRAIREGK
jgi:hypothetical protein